jgi:hypothetical protein
LKILGTNTPIWWRVYVKKLLDEEELVGYNKKIIDSGGDKNGKCEGNF